MDISRVAVAEVELRLRCGGKRGLFIVEVGSRARANDLLRYLAGLPGSETQPVAVGPVVACAVRVSESEEDLLERVAEHLRDCYTLSICEPGFTASMYRVALQLARDVEAEIIPLDHCALCGTPEPFATVMRIYAEDNSTLHYFCESCVRGVKAGSPRGICRALMRGLDGQVPWREAAIGRAWCVGDTWHFLPRQREDAGVECLDADR